MAYYGTKDGNRVELTKSQYDMALRAGKQVFEEKSEETRKDTLNDEARKNRAARVAQNQIKKEEPKLPAKAPPYKKPPPKPPKITVNDEDAARAAAKTLSLMDEPGFHAANKALGGAPAKRLQDEAIRKAQAIAQREEEDRQRKRFGFFGVPAQFAVDAWRDIKRSRGM